MTLPSPPCGPPVARRNPHAVPAALLAVVLGGCVVAPPRPLPRVTAPPPPLGAPPMFFYPERGQTAERQDRDRYECYRLAVRDSGIDPGMTPVMRPWTPPPQARRDGADVVGGAATGAIVGAAVSGPRHAGQNAVFGAVFGALLGAAAQESRAQAAEAVAARQAQAAARAQQPRADFQRAIGACMRARGYTVG